MHGDGNKHKPQSKIVEVPTIVPLPEKFIFFTSYVSETTVWCEEITNSVKALKWRVDPISFAWFEVRERLDAVYSHIVFRSLVWFAIMVCFVSAMNRWWSPNTRTLEEQEVDEKIDDVLFVIFAVELMFMMVSKFPACLSDVDFYLNLIVVIVSLIPRLVTSAVGNDALALRTLRLMRLVSTLRFFKWFKQLEGARGSLGTVAKRLLFVLFFLVATALIATSFFWDRHDLSTEFGNFSRSFFTMFMVGVAGDSSVTWTASQDPDTELLVPLFAFFFVCHIFGCYGLFVYAVLGFFKEDVDETESTTLDMSTLNYYRQSPIDPLLSEMCKYITEDELQAMIEVSERVMSE